MGLFAYIKNGVKYKMNQFPGAYPASRVSYNGSDVETALDELNADMFKLPTGFDWTNKDQLTSGVEYTVPSDGFIRLVCGRTNGNNVALDILGTTVATMSYCTGMTQATSLLQLIPVYKGWKCTFTASNTTDGSSAYFAPYTYS